MAIYSATDGEDVATVEQVFNAIFTVELIIILVLLAFNTYLFTYRPVLSYLREIYFVNSQRFKRAWYLVIGGISFFIIAQSLSWARDIELLPPSPTIEQVFQTVFGILMILAFMEIVLILKRYIPAIGADDETVNRHITQDLRRSIKAQDQNRHVKLDVSIGADIYGGRPTLGPSVSLSHYRAALLGITQYLEQRFGELGDTLLYSVGLQTGHNAAKGIQDEGVEPDHITEEFFQSMMMANIGIPRILQRTDHRINVRLDECCVCAGMKPIGATACHYISGLMAGFFEATLGVTAESREVKCSGKKDTYCEFQVELLDATSA